MFGCCRRRSALPSDTLPALPQQRRSAGRAASAGLWITASPGTHSSRRSQLPAEEQSHASPAASSESVLAGAERGECRFGRVHCFTRGQRVCAIRARRWQRGCARSGVHLALGYGICAEKGCEENLRLFLVREVLSGFCNWCCYRLCVVGYTDRKGDKMPKSAL